MLFHLALPILCILFIRFVVPNVCQSASDGADLPTRRSSTSLQINGQALGPGVYFASHLSVSYQYASMGLNVCVWDRRKASMARRANNGPPTTQGVPIASTQERVVAVCEVIDDAVKLKSGGSNGFFVCNDDTAQRIRALLVYPAEGAGV
jgi:hypothetical protein